MRDGLSTASLELSRECLNALDLVHENPLRAIRNLDKLRDGIRTKSKAVRQEVLLRGEVSHTTEAERAAVRSFIDYLVARPEFSEEARELLKDWQGATEADLAVAVVTGRHLGRMG